MSSSHGKCSPQTILAAVGGGCSTRTARSLLLQEDRQNSSTLHLAIEKQCEAAVLRTFLVQMVQESEKLRAFAQDFRPREGEPPDPVLTALTRNDHVTVIRTLIAAGSDVAATNHLGWTPLHCAVFHHWGGERAQALGVVGALLRGGAHVNATAYDGSTPLHFAASRSGSFEVVRALLRAGADTTARNSEGNTPLHVAVLHQSKDDVLEEILRHAPSPTSLIHWPNDKGRSPLQLATPPPAQMPFMTVTNHDCLLIKWAELLEPGGAETEKFFEEQNQPQLHKFWLRCREDTRSFLLFPINQSLTLHSLLVTQILQLEGDCEWWAGHERVLDYQLDESSPYASELVAAQQAVMVGKALCRGLPSMAPHAWRAVVRYLGKADLVNVALASEPELKRRRSLEHDSEEEAGLKLCQRLERLTVRGRRSSRRPQ